MMISMEKSMKVEVEYIYIYPQVSEKKKQGELLEMYAVGRLQFNIKIGVPSIITFFSEN